MKEVLRNTKMLRHRLEPAGGELSTNAQHHAPSLTTSFSDRRL